METQPFQDVVAHWSALVENFTTSSTGFYQAVEEGIRRRQVPGVETSHIDWSEGGILSPNREYLRVAGDRHHVDICAAPFGTGYFFSSWTRPHSRCARAAGARRASSGS
jgi:hypothetical protein